MDLLFSPIRLPSRFTDRCTGRGSDQWRIFRSSPAIAKDRFFPSWTNSRPQWTFKPARSDVGAWTASSPDSRIPLLPSIASSFYPDSSSRLQHPKRRKLREPPAFRNKGQYAIAKGTVFQNHPTIDITSPTPNTERPKEEVKNQAPRTNN